MISRQQHIIHRVNIDIDVPDLAAARHIYQDFSSIWNERIVPEIEKRLAGLEDEQPFIRFHKLSLEYTVPDAEKMEKTIAVAISQSIHRSIDGVKREQQLDQQKVKWTDEQLQVSETKKSNPFHSSKETASPKNEDPNNVEVSVDKVYFTKQKIADCFIYFLAQGRLPWYASASTNWLDENVVMEMAGKMEQWPELMDTLVFYPSAIQRLSRQFSKVFLLFIIDKFYGRKQDAGALIKGIEAVAGKNNEQAKELTTVYLQQLIDLYKPAENKIKGKEIASSNETNTAPGQPDTVIERNVIDSETPEITNPVINIFNKSYDTLLKEVTTDPAEAEAVFVDHGGLILLHPFLQYFFKDFDLLDEDDFRSHGARETAVHLLYHLSTGKENPYEHELVFIKHLCGWPKGIVVNRFVEITDAMKAEAGKLLNAVIHHWKVLKNTSADGLREAFLQRRGKLVLADHQHKLLLEKSSIDILLEQLPWNHSIISLPWMDRILYADWQILS